MNRGEVREHLPVMVGEVVRILAEHGVSFLLDGTVGAGGHSGAFLACEGSGARILGIDRDPEMVERARERLADYAGQVELVSGNYANLEAILGECEFGDEVDAALLDLGASSVHFDDPDRGFSFSAPGPLDMRYDRRAGETAADLVNRLPERELADLLHELGDERRSRRIAAAIVRERPIRDTLRLAEVVRAAAGGGGRIHPATRTFQAIRMRLNSELENVERGVAAAIRRVRPGGLVLVLCFHSGEDRVVKQVMRDAVKAGRARLLFPKPLRPGPREIGVNPRARSARLRACERVRGEGG